jgi:hypothetical protein
MPSEPSLSPLAMATQVSPSLPGAESPPTYQMTALSL